MELYFENVVGVVVINLCSEIFFVVIEKFVDCDVGVVEIVMDYVGVVFVVYDDVDVGVVGVEKFVVF